MTVLHKDTLKIYNTPEGIKTVTVEYSNHDGQRLIMSLEKNILDEDIVKIAPVENPGQGAITQQNYTRYYSKKLNSLRRWVYAFLKSNY